MDTVPLPSASRVIVEETATDLAVAEIETMVAAEGSRAEATV